MKNLINFLLVLLCLTSISLTIVGEKETSTSVHTYKNNRFRSSTVLDKAILDFLYNANENKVNLSRLEDLEGIYYGKLYGFEEGHTFGVTLLKEDEKDVIFINADIPLYLETFIEGLIYHEMYHFLLNEKDHCNDSTCPFIINDGSLVSPEYIIKNWNQERKKEYFDYIKENK